MVVMRMRTISHNNGIIRHKVQCSTRVSALSDALSGIAAESLDWRDTWPIVATILHLAIKRAIATKGADLSELSFGKLWSPNTRYLREKNRTGKGTRDFFATGETFLSLGEKRGLLSNGRKSMRFGTRGPHVQLLNFVRRPFLGMTRKTMQDVNDVVQSRMLMKIKEQLLKNEITQ